MRVVIAEDQVLLRAGLARLFADGGHEIIATMGDAEQLPATVATLHPDLGILVLSQHVETIHSVELITHGGFGYLLKDRVLDVTDFLAPLTERERTVLELVAQGLTNTAIAKRLVLSERTIEAHVRHLFDKLNLTPDEDGHRRGQEPRC